MKTYSEILEDMLSRIPDKIDRREGSVIYDALAPAAAEMAQLYIDMVNIMEESFADTQSREFLIRRAAERGLSPHEATNAILLGEFLPSDIDVIGKRFRIDTMYYKAVEKIEDGRFKMMAETAGIEGNHYFGSLIPVDYIQGLKEGLLTEILIPGCGEEDTEAFRTRYLDSISNLAFGGNRADYLEKVMDIQGVGSVRIFPFWNGGGTVKISILDSSFNKAGSTIIDTVQKIIDPTGDGEGYGLAPIGHSVTVDTPSEISVFIETKLLFENGYGWYSVKDDVYKFVEDYLLSLRKRWGKENKCVARLAHIESGILGVKGILDIYNTKINGVEENLMFSEEEIPVFGGVSLGA